MNDENERSVASAGSGSCITDAAELSAMRQLIASLEKRLSDVEAKVNNMQDEIDKIS